jgi:hypothetical protein
MANPHNKWLKKNIETILIPAIRDMGFLWRKQGTSKEVGREIVLGMPFGDMRRPTGCTIDVIEIHLQKRDRSFFALYAGRFPAEGVRDYLHGKHHYADEVRTGDLEEYWVMSACPRLFMDFGFRFKSLRSITEADYKSLAQRVASYLPEIQEAMVTGKLGPHMKHVQMPRVYETKSNS